MAGVAPGWTGPPGKRLVRHITPQYMGEHHLGPFSPLPGTYPGVQGSKNGYFMAKSRPKWQGWLQAGPVLMYRPNNLPAPAANPLGLRPQNLQRLMSYCCGSAQANACPVGERLVGACSHCAAALCFTAVYPANPAAFPTTHRCVRLVDRKNPVQMDAEG